MQQLLHRITYVLYIYFVSVYMCKLCANVFMRLKHLRKLLNINEAHGKRTCASARIHCVINCDDIKIWNLQVTSSLNWRWRWLFGGGCRVENLFFSSSSSSSHWYTCFFSIILIMMYLFAIKRHRLSSYTTALRSLAIVTLIMFCPLSTP